MLSNPCGVSWLLSKDRAQRGWLQFLRVPVKSRSGNARGLLNDCLAIHLRIMVLVYTAGTRLLEFIASGIDGTWGHFPLKPNVSFGRSLCNSVDIWL